MTGSSRGIRAIATLRFRALVVLACASGGVVGAQSTARRLPKQATVTAARGTGRSVALVIGNKAYPKRPLVNPENDARDLARVLREELGYEVDLVLDATKARMAEAVDAFTAKLGRDDVGLFYFAGHGVQVKGENFLLPVDFAAKTESAVPWEAYSAQRVLAQMSEKGARLTLLVLDACRDNPYRSWRGGGGGLAAMQGATGALVAFAAADGATADENPGERNGLFTKHLLRELKVPGLSVGQVFDRVRDGVWKESNGRQVPFSYSGVIGEYVMRPGTATSPGPGTGTTVDRAAQELGFWNGIVGSSDAADFEEYLQKVRGGEFPGTYKGVAERKLAALRKVKPVESPTPVVLAEAGPKPTPRGVEQPALRARPEPAEGNEITNAIGMKLVWIPPGEFDMGSPESEAGRMSDEGPVHRVRLTKGFYLGKYEVTQGEWQAVMGNNPSEFKACGPDCPVEQVTWEGVQTFLRKLGERDGTAYRLPTEAEWEYAVRAGSPAPRYGEPKTIAWYDVNKRVKTHKVGLKVPNRWGLHDMQGNVSEFVADWQGDYGAQSPQLDPTGPGVGSVHLSRGCSWINDREHYCRAAARYGDYSSQGLSLLGLRAARGR